MNESVDLLRSHFDLTPSEARLTLRLLAGDKLQSAAVKLDISYETARGHLKNIFNKTGARRQAELVVLIVRALPACCLETSRSKLRQPPAEPLRP
jgi:DNA-binding CsgD family transcriptional regulator